MKGRNAAVGGLVFAVGLIGGLIGFMTDAYSSTAGVIIMLAVWFIGGAIAAIALRGKGA
jgi:hypothetical protein